MISLTVSEPAHEFSKTSEFHPCGFGEPVPHHDEPLDRLQASLGLTRRKFTERKIRPDDVRISDEYRPSVSEPCTIEPILEPPLPRCAAGAQRAQPVSPRSLAPLTMPQRRWTPTCSSPGTRNVRNTVEVFLLWLTLSVVCSPLPRKSLKASEERPVNRRHDRSNTADGCFSMVRT